MNDTRHTLLEDLARAETDDDRDAALDDFVDAEGNGYGYYEKDAVTLLRTAANNLDRTLADALMALSVADVEVLLLRKLRNK